MLCEPRQQSSAGLRVREFQPLTLKPFIFHEGSSLPGRTRCDTRESAVIEGTHTKLRTPKGSVSPFLVPKGGAVQFLPMQTPLRHQGVHHGAELIIVMSLKEVHHLVQQYVLQA